MRFLGAPRRDYLPRSTSYLPTLYAFLLYRFGDLHTTMQATTMLLLRLRFRESLCAFISLFALVFGPYPDLLDVSIMSYVIYSTSALWC
jgi:hypothetical protein